MIFARVGGRRSATDDPTEVQHFREYRDGRFVPVNPTARPTSHQPTSAVLP